MKKYLALLMVALFFGLVLADQVMAKAGIPNYEDPEIRILSGVLLGVLIAGVALAFFTLSPLKTVSRLTITMVSGFIGIVAALLFIFLM